MRNTSALKSTQGGFILTMEFMLFISIMVIGLTVGWLAMRDSFNAELVDTANAIESSITLYYFNDPNRGAGPAFVGGSLQFDPPSGSE